MKTPKNDWTRVTVEQGLSGPAACDAPCASRRLVMPCVRPARSTCASVPLRAVMWENARSARVEAWVYGGLVAATVGAFAMACWQTGIFISALPTFRHALGLLAG